MQYLTTDALILFNSIEPVKTIKEIILNSTNVQDAFKKSCFEFMHASRKMRELYGVKAYFQIVDQ